MTTALTIRRAGPETAPEVAAMVGELLAEITGAIGSRLFNFSLTDTVARLGGFLERERYVVFCARTESGEPVGFIALYESNALYAEGAFGTIPELYVRPAYRGGGLGRQLLSCARAFGASRGWTRLEVTTPPLPQFDRTLTFYEREGFVITGGRKLKALL
jgi:GNAT superfamily N-acetyltransferase